MEDKDRNVDDCVLSGIYLLCSRPQPAGICLCSSHEARHVWEFWQLSQPIHSIWDRCFGTDG